MRRRSCVWLYMIAMLLVQELDSTVCFVILAEADTSETYVINAADYGVDGSDTDVDTEAIQSLLDLAKGTSSTVEIHIPAGTYYIDGVLYIYSDTKLILDEDAVMMRTNPRNIMLMGNVESGKLEDYGGYTQISNVTIQGGTWDGNGESGESYGQIIVIFHGDGITVSDLTLQNGNNHFLNLSGDRNVVVSNVTFANAYEYQGDDETFWGGLDSAERYNANEVLHLDYITEDGESTAYPVDGTVCQNIVITDCTFENVFAGVGTHHLHDGMTSTGITVQNCVFTNVTNYCIDADGFTDLTVTGNEVSECGGFVIGERMEAIISYNTVSVSAYKSVVYLKEGSDCTITDNDFSGGAYCYVFLSESNAIVTGNSFTEASIHAVRVKTGSTADIKSNSFTDDALLDINVDETSSAVISDNTMTGSGSNSIIISGIEAEITSNQIYNTGASAIAINEASEVFVSDNLIENAAGNGIYAVNSNDIVISNNTIQSATANGLYFDNSSVTVSGCDIYDVGKAGIFANSCAADVLNNVINNYATNAIAATGSSSVVTVSGNIIDGSGSNSHAISLISCADGCAISENTVTDPQANGIQVYEMSSVYVYGNKVTGATGHGILLKTCTDSTVCNNIVNTSAKIGIYLHTSCSSVTVCHNETTNNETYGIVFVDSSDIVVTENTAVGNETYDISGYKSSGEITYNIIGSSGIYASSGITVSDNEVDGRLESIQKVG